MLWNLFWVVVALAVSETVRRYLPDFLPLAWLLILTVVTWQVLNSQLGTQATLSIATVVRSQLALSYVIVAILGASLFTGFWYGINRILVKPEKSDEIVSTVSNESPFLTSMMATVRTDQRDVSSRFWMGHLTEDGYTISPTNVVFSLRITNLQPHAAMIAGLSIEVRDSDGNWVEMRRLTTFGRDIYSAPGDNLSDARLLELDLLDELLLNNSLQPHEPIAGWIFYEYPESPDQATFLNEFRVTITDTLGGKFVMEPTPLAQVEGSDTMQFSTIKTGEQRDLSVAIRTR